MIDPITAMLATGAGVNFVKGIADDAAQAADDISQAASTADTSFEDAFSSTGKTALKKLLAAHPELAAQLGDGPYTLAQDADGSLTISSQTSGISMALDASTPAGKQAQTLLKLSSISSGASSLTTA